MERIAIIGTGIAGMACAHRLHRFCDLTIFERNARVGGHTNTVQVESQGESLAVDTGFMVYNEVTYPLLTRLFAELDVPTMPTDMSFGVHHSKQGIAYCGSTLNQLFAQRRNLVKPVFWRMIGDILRFNRIAEDFLESNESEYLLLSELLERGSFGSAFQDYYLLPMTAAIWSTPPHRMLDFPALSLLRFMKNHGLLGVRTQHQWRTVVGGSMSYRDKLIKPFRDRIETSNPAVAVLRRENGADVIDSRGHCRHFDRVVLASHADQTLKLLDNPTEEEKELLGAFRYSRSETMLHTDARVMPRWQRAWASWNYRYDPDEDEGERGSTHYWMNSLQKVSARQNVFVSLNGGALIDPSKVLWKTSYAHPMFDGATQRAQRRLPRLNRRGGLFFCGSYFRYGFHEDALMSGLNAADRILEELRSHAVVSL